MRLLSLAYAATLFVSFAHSMEETLFTSSVTYCTPPETILIQQFDLAYIANNNSISFNISAASVEANVTVQANIFMNVYGMKPINKTIDICNILNGALCPLPMYNFTGTDSLTLPSSLGVSNRIPKIAFHIPDLEAYAQFSLIEVGTGSVKACVQATLSNGWSARQTAVEWTTIAMAVLALLIAIPQSFVPNAAGPFRLFDLLFLYQSIAGSAFLNLNYPSVYRSFALNFAWSMGLIFTSLSSSVQNTINHMRHKTGGKMLDASGSAIGFVNRKLSPYNDALVNPSALLSTSPRNTAIGVGSIVDIVNSPSREVSTVTQSSANILQAGIPIYVNSVNIGTANAFMTVFFCALILVAISAALFGLGYAVILAVHRHRRAAEERCVELKRAYPGFVKAWSLRLSLVAFTPIIIFAMYQWTLKDSWLSLVFSVITFLAIFGGILYPVFLTHRLVAHSKPYDLYTTPDRFAVLGPLFAQYRPSRYYFFTPLLAAFFIKAALIAFLQNHGEAQVIAIMVTEILLLLAYATLRPHTTRGGDVLATLLTVARLVATGLSVGFVERFGLAAIPRVVIGIVVAIVLSVAVLGVWVNVLLRGYTAVRDAMRWRRRARGEGNGRDKESSSSMAEMEGGLVRAPGGDPRGSFGGGSTSSGAAYEANYGRRESLRTDRLESGSERGV